MTEIKLKQKYIKLKEDLRLHKLDIPVIGLTGGIATGKSAVSKFLKEQNFCVIDADFLIKEIYKQSETINFIEKLSPTATINGKINFKVLREIFFKDKSTQEKIETYLYPQLRKFFLIELEKFKETHSVHLVIYDVPLLFEKKLESLVDLTVLVYCPKETQLERLISRDKITPEMAQNILSHQIDIEDKKRKCDFVIDNTKDLKNLKKETFKVFKLFLED